MDNSHLPRMIFYGQLQQGERSRGRQRKQYKDTLKANLTMLDVNPAHLESLTADRTSWHALCRQSIGSFEDSRVSHAEIKRRLRKTGHTSTSTSSTVQCDVCDGLVTPGLDYFHTKEHICDQRSVVSTAQSIIMHNNAGKIMASQLSKSKLCGRSVKRLNV